MFIFFEFDWDQLMETILEHSWKEKSVKLPNLNVMFLKSNQDTALQSHRILKMFVWWGWGVGEQELSSHFTNVWKIWWPCGVISLLALDISPLNTASFLILRCSFQQCQWISGLYQNLKIQQKGLLILHVKNNITC